MTLPYFTDTTGLQMTVGDKISCKFQSDVTRLFIDSLNSVYGVEIYDEKPSAHNRFLLKVTENAQLSTLEIANLYYELNETEYCHPAFVIDLIPDEYRVYDYYRQFQWNIARVMQAQSVNDRHRAWEITTGDSNIIIAVLGDGVAEHEDISADRLLTGFNTIYNTYSGSPCSIAAHAQAVAGLIVASHTTDSSLSNDRNTGMYGIAPECRILPIKMRRNAICDTLDPEPEYIERSVDTAVAMGADIIVGAWHFTYPWDAMDEALENALNNGRGGKGCPLIFSAGNAQSFGDTITGYPANYDYAISVAATGDDDTLAYYTKRTKTDIVAPGGSFTYLLSLDQMGENGLIISGSIPKCMTPVDPDYWCTFRGTSASCAQAAGTMALILSFDSSLTWLDAASVLMASGDIYLKDTNYNRPNDVYGWGMVSPLKALLSISRGDVDNNHGINVADLSYLIDFMFNGGPEPIPHVWRGDVNCDAETNVSDISFLVDVLWGGLEIPSPCYRFDGVWW